MPLVRSMIWSGMTKSRGLMASCREPTALKAMMVRTPRLRRAAMLARAGTSWGAISWCRPWRDRKATGMGLPSAEEWCRTVMGEEGVPHGVVGLSEATGVKPGRDCRPVPPITAMGMGAVVVLLVLSMKCLVLLSIAGVGEVGDGKAAYHRKRLQCWPFCGNQCVSGV